MRESPRFRAKDGTDICGLLHPAREEGISMGYSLAHAVLGPGEASAPHRLKISLEVYFILEGRGKMHIGGESAEVAAGQAVDILPGSVLHIENVGEGPLVFLSPVSPPWREEDEELI
ncbi:cupin domain-containing protein [Candidatus Methanocrinis natronophilus]|uniref:Cupin domain-containing protein n=1 Tax=Candidatus Methanocrinis natronophilus TaxID=3033396 RepID=A0ABT5X8Z5_9EURY|nr:cupin domain-containing protein [Candidatus Methanocrinis natronophilus]MDF0591179.1 cupin domain-containing protein [Candidatus Methanocrinis natronophilus]